MVDEPDSPTIRATEAKRKGDAHFSAGNYQDAVKNYTDAINLVPSDFVNFLNRSKAQAALGEFKEALLDANLALSLKPDSPDGFLRRGSALYGLRQFKEAVSAYEEGLKAVSAYKELKSGLALAQAEVEKLDSMWLKLQLDGETSRYLSDPDFGNMMHQFFQSPSSLNLHDRKFMRALGVLSDAVRIQPNGRDGVLVDALLMGVEGETSSEWAVKEEEENARIMKERKENAKKEKENGNAAYYKEFQMAIECFSKAIELDDEDISFLTNRAAAYLAMGNYDECIKTDQAVERGRELLSDCKLVARALARKGTALVKMAKLSSDFDAAIQCFQDSLLEHWDSETLKKQREQ